MNVHSMYAHDIDVLVAGGGPAGLSAAFAAARAGARTRIIEQSNEIGVPIRTTGGSFIADLRELGIPPHLYHPISTIRFVSPNREARFVYPEPRMCVLDIHGTFQFLAGQAVESGAEIMLGTTALEPLQENGAVRGATVRDGRGREHIIRSKVLIDATGYRCSLLRKAGVHRGFQRFGVGAEYDLYAPNYNQDEVVLLVGGQVAPAGYAWAFPWGRKRVRAGVGIIHADSTAKPDDYLDLLIRDGSRWGMNFQGAQAVEYHHGLIPSDGMPESFAGDGIMGAGDAGGQSSTLVGEGIRWSIRAGRMAGAVAAESIRRSDHSRRFLSRFEKEWRSEFGLDLKLAAEVNRRMAGWSEDKWDRRTALLSLLSPDEFEHVLKNDLAGGWALKLLWSRPELVREGFGALLRKVGFALSR